MGLGVRFSDVRVLDSNTKIFGTNINTACQLISPAKIYKWTGELSSFPSDSEAAAPMLPPHHSAFACVICAYDAVEDKVTVKPEATKLFTVSTHARLPAILGRWAPSV